ncbi:uncharacterized protein FIBRA_09485 [Fibroporia radiculosa]|uniref:Uncharacterized protein n=1 Tax=Fibroporia radiculosa TaxID=599839 RepID=J7RHV4_9APHY|nr:uncharacterized protein FIBRA_09485 [Fibroporia radiculosa]CCM07147.1 predicted protein [Fibroporia radiculosa]
MPSIIAWKVAGEFVIPKNMTVGLNNPHGVINAPFHLSSSLILTLLYPVHRSSLVNIVGLAEVIRSNRSSTRGIGPDMAVDLLIFLLTKKNGDAIGDFDGWM